MNVFLTGANGFVGSHILARLLRENHRVHILLRRTSDTSLIEDFLPEVSTHYGSLGDRESLQTALDCGPNDALVHCAGKTKAVRVGSYYGVNVGGMGNLCGAIRGISSPPRRVILISSMAAGGPGTISHPAAEDDPPRPVSHYGRSKLQAEGVLKEECPVPWTILRPSAVYGPGDTDFFDVFRAVDRGIIPLLGGGRQPVSLIYAPDLARAVLGALDSDRAIGRTYNVANPRPVTTGELPRLIADIMDRRALPLPIPLLALYPVCLLKELQARITGTPHILNMQKMREYSAEGWVCDTARARRELDFTAPTDHRRGLTDQGL